MSLDSIVIFIAQKSNRARYTCSKKREVQGILVELHGCYHIYGSRHTYEDKSDSLVLLKWKSAIRTLPNSPPSALSTSAASNPVQAKFGLIHQARPASARRNTTVVGRRKRRRFDEHQSKSSSRQDGPRHNPHGGGQRSSQPDG